jgi:hypothetical protein
VRQLDRIFWRFVGRCALWWWMIPPALLLAVITPKPGPWSNCAFLDLDRNRQINLSDMYIAQHRGNEALFYAIEDYILTHYDTSCPY